MRRLRSWARNVRKQALAVWFCCRHPRAPLLARLVAWMVAAYAFSPINVFPGFIPVLGDLDDVIFRPLLILFTLKLVPRALVAECHEQAQQHMVRGRGKPRGNVGAAAILLGWAGAAAVAWWWMLKTFPY